MPTPLKHRSSLDIIEDWIRTNRLAIVGGWLTYADKRIVERECSLLEDMAIAIADKLDAFDIDTRDAEFAMDDVIALRDRLRKMVQS